MIAFTSQDSPNTVNSHWPGALNLQFNLWQSRTLQRTLAQSKEKRREAKTVFETQLRFSKATKLCTVCCVDSMDCFASEFGAIAPAKLCRVCIALHCIANQPKALTVSVKPLWVAGVRFARSLLVSHFPGPSVKDTNFQPFVSASNSWSGFANSSILFTCTVLQQQLTKLYHWSWLCCYFCFKSFLSCSL